LTSIQNEEKAQEELAQSMQTMDELVSKCSESTEYIVGVYPQVQERFNFKYDESAIHRLNAQHFELMVNVADLKKEISSKEKPASELLTTCKELYSALGNCSNEVLEIKKIIDQARSDEERAKKQLLKLQLIMNEIQVKIVKNKLPSISKSYEGDLLKAKEYVLSIENLLKESPLNTKLLNATLDSAIDFIYKLYNNVNNVVGMALMVENTIVFGNKYRSEYSEVDSELTRAELCYRNGEYTQALTIAIAAIEKLFPQTYESMIKENALSAK
ncbi:MAG: septation ring formation regulator EzrA, partial [Erysipelotrichaceae bacterium]|nr:septation ring formation regulator EzrA [Erysipelotrichaceae bacterium]